ncbi:restriction endonuclease [Leptospirillum ferrooxidans C2-3]|uniref:Restriction endonuclease n=2 Tax=Leptospirillum ferrooxidans TaxID=180 RepID=I0ILB9_LEPFC|nr:restriction endonuclease [Leptospirillum ferrooxidans C2-3]
MTGSFAEIVLLLSEKIENFTKDLPAEERRLISLEEFRNGGIQFQDTLELVRYFDSNPDEIFSLMPREFEIFVSKLLEKHGYQVTLGKGSRDGGVDIFAERRCMFGTELTLVQCKRNRKDRKVGEPVVKQLFGDIESRNATKGLLVTTSTFTGPALVYIESVKYRMSLIDFGKLQNIISALKKDPSCPVIQ